jgi:hypothetical protein
VADKRLTWGEFKARQNAGASIPPDGLWLHNRIYVDGTGQVIGMVHLKKHCRGRPCPIHNPSDHSMRGFRTHFRTDRYLMERICPHGVGHPDPDDLAFQKKAMPDRASGVHGCDGCCRPYEPVVHGVFKMRSTSAG